MASVYSYKLTIDCQSHGGRGPRQLTGVFRSVLWTDVLDPQLLAATFVQDLVLVKGYIDGFAILEPRNFSLGIAHLTCEHGSLPLGDGQWFQVTHNLDRD